LFTGLIRECADIVLFDGSNLQLRCNYKPNIGDSICINGACLSVTKLYDDGFLVHISKESKKFISSDTYTNRVHIEPAMRLKDRLDGHIVQGHIDGIGKIYKIEPLGESLDIYIRVDLSILEFLVPKGSIALNGVSLTINDVFDDGFRVTIIPISLKDTLFESYIVGTFINVEIDMFAKYIYNFLKKDKNKNISWGDIDKTMALY